MRSTWRYELRDRSTTVRKGGIRKEQMGLQDGRGMSDADIAQQMETK